jgi:ankyrin repeat protein
MIDAFLRLVGEGQLEAVRKVLVALPDIVNQTGSHPFWGGRPQPLHVAVETKRKDMFDLLLEAGADPNGTNDEYEHWSPFMLAIDRKQPEMQSELLRHGASIGLLEALMLGDDSLTDSLLIEGLPEITPNAGSILNFARTTHAIDQLIELGAATGVKDRWGSTPIDSFSRQGKDGEPLVRHMISLGIEAPPELYARLNLREEFSRLLEKDPGLIHSQAVFMGAVDFRRHEFVRWLIEKGADANSRTTTQSRHTALHSAAWNGDLEMVKLLVEAGADQEAVDEEYKTTPFHWAEVSLCVTNNPAVQEVIDNLRPR